jgi:hypothetical protein
VRCHAIFERCEQCSADALALPALGGGEKHDPALRVRGPADRGRDDLITVHCDNGVVLLAGGKHLGEAIDRLDLRGRDLLPETKDAVEIVGVEVSNAPTGHCGSLA